jgi:hypothetical protein
LITDHIAHSDRSGCRQTIKQFTMSLLTLSSAVGGAQPNDISLPQAANWKFERYFPESAEVQIAQSKILQSRRNKESAGEDAVQSPGTRIGGRRNCFSSGATDFSIDYSVARLNRPAHCPLALFSFEGSPYSPANFICRRKKDFTCGLRKFSRGSMDFLPQSRMSRWKSRRSATFSPLLGSSR